FHEYFKRFPNPKPILVWTGVLTRLPLLFFMLFPSTLLSGQGSFWSVLFLGIFCIYYLSTPIIFPAINQLLKSNYSFNKLGYFYSYATSIKQFVTFVVTFLVGIVYDHDPSIFRILYPVLGIMGIVSILFLSRIEFKITDNKEFPKVFQDSGIIAIYRKTLNILKTNIAFRDYEIAFMLYGIGWMSTSSVSTLFFAKELNLNYTSIALYKNIYYIVSILLLPFFGKLLVKLDPRKFLIIPLSAVAVHFFFLIITGFFPVHTIWGTFMIYYWLIPSYLAYSVFDAGMTLSWNIGSAYLCNVNESAYYQAFHLSLTGVRAIFAPIVGVLIYENTSFSHAFSFGIIFILIAIVWMWRSLNRIDFYRQC
ncbi:MAG TPA: MFS transporter, partial [Salinivirgaceae bacterium]|nr:MFS transporter [Salinivirgaceae bacterium]